MASIGASSSECFKGNVTAFTSDVFGPNSSRSLGHEPQDVPAVIHLPSKDNRGKWLPCLHIDKGRALLSVSQKANYAGMRISSTTAERHGVELILEHCEKMALSSLPVEGQRGSRASTLADSDSNMHEKILMRDQDPDKRKWQHKAS